MPETLIADCWNCSTKHSIADLREVCMLEALVGMEYDGGLISADRAKALIERTDPDALWNALGPVIDDLIAGYFCNGDEELPD